MKEGYIKLYRKSLESIVFTSEKGWKIWTWCLLKANHEPNEFFLGRTKISLKPGQFVMGRNTANSELGMAVGTIWYWLDILEKEGNIERKSTNKYSIITILKWKDYQTTERRLNADRTQIGHQIEPNKNDKNVKNDKNLTKSKAESASYGNPLINELIKYYSELIGGSLDGSQAENRNYANLLINRFKKDYPTREPVELIKMLIDRGVGDSFHGKNLTNFKYLYYNAQKIIQAVKADINKNQIIKVS